MWRYATALFGFFLFILQGKDLLFGVWIKSKRQVCMSVVFDPVSHEAERPYMPDPEGSVPFEMLPLFKGGRAPMLDVFFRGALTRVWSGTDSRHRYVK